MRDTRRATTRNPSTPVHLKRDDEPRETPCIFLVEKRVEARTSMTVTQCAMCGRFTTTSKGLAPAACLRKYGPSKAHRICQACWFGTFAKEEGDHRCPGCLKNKARPVSKPRKNSKRSRSNDSVIVLSST